MTTSPERTAWVAVATQLRRDIGNGVVGFGGTLDTEAELCRRFDVSRITIRRALQQLRDEGLVTSKRGSGWRVRPTTRSNSLLIGTGARPDAAPPVVHREHHRWRSCRASAQASRAIRRIDGRPAKRELGLQWTYRQRANGVLFDLVEVWFAPAAASSVVRSQLELSPLTKSLAGSGVDLGETTQYVWADLPTDNERALFDSTDCAVLVLERVTRATNDELVCLSIHRHRGNYVHLLVDLPLSHINDGRVFGVASIG